MFIFLGKKIIAFLRSKTLLNWNYVPRCSFESKGVIIEIEYDVEIKL